jgi:hypothetical protein
VYSDFEDNYIGGDLDIAGLQTCFDGIARNNIQGGLSDIGNVFADPNANEVKTNQIHKDFDCSDNSPKVQFGAGGGASNQVVGVALGECNFFTLLPDPAPSGPLTPISVQT